MPISPQPAQRAGASLWPAALILWGRGARSSPHSHHCIQLSVPLSGTGGRRAGPGPGWRRCAAVLPAPDVRHEIDASEGPVLIGFFDPESELAASLRSQMASGITVASDAVADGWRAILGDSTEIDETRVDRWVHSELFRDRQPRPLHPGVQRAVDYLRSGGLQERQLSAKYLS